VSNHEEEERELNRQVELLALLEGLHKLENEVKSQYWAYDFPYERPISYSLPMVRQEVEGLLKYMYRLLYHLEDFLKKTQSYNYYHKYINRYFQEIKPYSRYYGFCYSYKNFLEDKERFNSLSEREKKDLEKAEMISEMFNRPEIYEQMKRKTEWSKLPVEQKLHKLINDWYSEFTRQRRELSKQEPDYVIERVSRNYWRLKKR